MPAPRPFVLTLAQRAELVQVRDHERRPYLRERAAALLQLAEGWSMRRAARESGLRPRRPETIAVWRERYLAGGLAGLVQRPRRPRGPAP
jgi:hypothetical protein